MNHPKIGIRPIIDGRCNGIRESLEELTMRMADIATKVISENLFYLDGSPVECVIAPSTIGGVAQAAQCASFFQTQDVCATLSVTPCWCYGSETMDIDPLTIKAVWGFNGTERPGAVYLAAAMAAHAQRGLPAFAIYGQDVQDLDQAGEVPEDVKEKLLRFARCAIAVGAMRGKSYVGIGGVSMGIMGSFSDPLFMQKYLGIRTEWVDMSEVHRRVTQEIYDHGEFEKAIAWVKLNCTEGYDKNPSAIAHSPEQKQKEWEFVVKMTLICRDILLGNPALSAIGFPEEALGRNGIAGGFQGQRMWSDWLANGDFTETILNTSFDWNGPKAPLAFATENDNLNAFSMLFANLLTGASSIFADVRTYWSPDAVEQATGSRPTGLAENGFIHLINSGSAALDGTGAAKDELGNGVMKPWWKMTKIDIKACLDETDWCPADLYYFRGGGFSSHFKTGAQMPVTFLRLNLIDGLGPALQIAEGYTVLLPEEIHKKLDERTDPTWPTTWFVPRLNGVGAFKDVYSLMANWGANHGALAYGHVGKDLIALASMLRIPVSLHNVEEAETARPHSWSAFGTACPEAADYRACQNYGPLYR